MEIKQEERDALRAFVLENIPTEESIWTKSGALVKRAATTAIKSNKKMRWDSKLRKLVPQMV